MLLDGGADANKARTDKRSTPLYIAAQMEHVEVMRVLLRGGADPDKESTHLGLTPLTYAAQLGLLEVVRCLIAAGATRARTSTPEYCHAGHSPPLAEGGE